MKIYRDVSVFDESLCRIRWLFSEFDNIVVSFSGGKDSTVVFNLTKIVAQEFDRKFYVLFLDQEAEYFETIRMVEQVMSDPLVVPLWVQVPFRLFNSNSNTEHWLYCWEPGVEWIRDKHPVSLKENVYGVDRFKKLSDAVLKFEVGENTAGLAGVRTAESLGRHGGLVSRRTYKDVTWGRTVAKELRIYKFFPIYDWSYRDVWSVICMQGWDYNKVYDYMYGLGVPTNKMRVSSLCHENTAESLFLLQEIEPVTWDKLIKRLPGIHTSGLNRFAIKCPKDYPYMFSSWVEYRDYLADNLLVPEVRDIFEEKFNKYDSIYGDDPRYFRMCIDCVLSNDLYFTKFKTFTDRRRFDVWRGKRG